MFLTVAAVYNYSFGRLLFVSGLEKRLPHQIGKVNRNKVPANAITLQTAISTILAVIGSSSCSAVAAADPYKAFYVLYAGVTIILVHLDGPAVPRHLLRQECRARSVRTGSGGISVGWLYTCGVVGFITNIVAVAFIFVGSWYPAGFPSLATWNWWI